MMSKIDSRKLRLGAFLAVKDQHMANRKLLIDRGDVKMDYKTAGI